MSAVRLRPDTFLAATGVLFAALMTNLLLVVGCAPLVLGLVVTDPTRSWPVLALVAPLCAPAIVAAFAVMVAIGEAGTWSREADRRGAPVAVLRVFGQAWWGSWRRATAVGALAVGALVVLGVDIAWCWGRAIGAAGIPVLVTLIVLVLSTALLALVALAERPSARLRDLLRASLYLGIRRWYLTAVSLAVLVLLVRIIAERPAIGLGLVASPMLYLVWAGSRFSLRPLLDRPPAPPAIPGTQPAHAASPRPRMGQRMA